MTVDELSQSLLGMMSRNKEIKNFPVIMVLDPSYLPTVQMVFPVVLDLKAVVIKNTK